MKTISQNTCWLRIYLYQLVKNLLNQLRFLEQSIGNYKSWFSWIMKGDNNGENEKEKEMSDFGKNLERWLSG